jgi:hypothetical protein
VDQAQDLRSERTRPSKNPPDSCWKVIFRVLFPNWPAEHDTPDPCEYTSFPYDSKTITNLQGNPDQANTVSTYCADAIQQHRERVMDQNTISRLHACQTEDEIRQLLGTLIRDLESNFGHTPITTNTLPSRPMPAMSTQPTIVVRTQQPQYQLLPVPQPTLTYSRGRHAQSHTAAGSSSDANSSRFPRSYDHSDAFTDCTGFSDRMSIGLDSHGSYQVTDNSNILPQSNTETTITVAQQPMGSYPPVPGFALGNAVTAPDDCWNLLHDPQYQPQLVGGDLVQDELQRGDYDENEMPSMAP